MLNEEKAYIAGFLDGDGCVMAQLVKHKDYKFGFQIRVSIVFYQKSSNQKILSWLKSKLKFGYIRQRNDGMSEYTIVGPIKVRETLVLLLPFLRLKSGLAQKVIKLVNQLPSKIDEKKLLRLSKLVDETAKFTYSKKRTNTSLTVQEYLQKHRLFPVETSI
jgi:hypothetical protein